MASFSDSPAPAATTGTTLIRLAGKDALPLLHRISTQSLNDLEPGQARATLFCDFRGRLLHRAIVAVTQDQAVWLIREDAPATDLAAFVERHVFREDVTIATPDPGLVVTAEHEPDGAPGGTVEERDGRPERVRIASDFTRVVHRGEDAEPIDTLERERIRAGRPRHGREIAEAFNPFEVGLAHEVHLSKGCFTGQEVLMRLVTYHSVRRRLVRLHGPGPPPRAPQPVRSAGADAGTLTSAIADANGWIALAVLRNTVLETAQPLEIDGSSEISTPEPFPETRPLGLA